MRVVGFVGSPRREGNTSSLVREIIAGAGEKGAETKIYDLNEISFRGCQGCRACKESGRCVLKDGMAEMSADIARADALIIGSPVYFGQVTGQLKLFMDRWYAFKNPDFSTRLAPGKRAILVFAQGLGDGEAYRPLFDGWARIIQSFQIKVQEIMVAAGMNEADAARNDLTFMAKAREAGRRLAG